MVDRHDRQIFSHHFRNQAPPYAGADDDVIGHDRAAMGDDALDAAILDDQRGRRRIAENLQLAGLFGGIDQLAGHGLASGNDEACIGIEHAALDLILFDQRKLFLDLGGRDVMGAGAESLGGGQLALDLLHPQIIAGAGDFKAADAGVVAHLFVEIDGILRGPDRKIIVAGRVAEIRGMGGRADIGRNA
ncbi:hypothetical protein D3C71_1538670 [compost metagenome]